MNLKNAFFVLVYLIPADGKQEIIHNSEIYAMLSPEGEKVSLGRVSSRRYIRLSNEERKGGT